MMVWGDNKRGTIESGRICIIRKEYLVTENNRWVQSPQTQGEAPNTMSGEAGVPVTEIPLNLSVGRLEKSPHIHKYHLEAVVKVPGN